MPLRFTPNCVKKSIETVLEPPKLLFYCYYFLIDILYFSLSVFKKLLLEAWSINIGDSIRYNFLAEISNFIRHVSDKVVSVLSIVFFKYLAKKDPSVLEKMKHENFLWVSLLLMAHC